MMALRDPYLLFIVQINLLLLALVSFHVRASRERGTSAAPHFIGIVLVFFIFGVAFLSSLLETLFPNSTVYTTGVMALLFIAVLYEVWKFSRGFAA